MDQSRNTDNNPREPLDNRLESRSSRPNDLPDSASDREKLRPEETTIDLPDVKDIPGQEFVNAPPAGSLGDTTISSDDEEGTSVFDRDDSEDLRTGTSGDLTRGERSALRNSDYMPTRDEDNLQQASMDNTDFQGEPLNERAFGDERSGNDLDVPGAELDDRDEASGEEDEENNNYSVGDNR